MCYWPSSNSDKSDANTKPALSPHNVIIYFLRYYLSQHLIPTVKFSRTSEHLLTRLRCQIWFQNWWSWWHNQMETFSALLAICAGNSPVPGEFPAQRPVTRNFHVFFDPRLNKRLSKQSWGCWLESLSRPLWRHCNVYVGLSLFCCHFGLVAQQRWEQIGKFGLMVWTRFFSYFFLEGSLPVHRVWKTGVLLWHLGIQPVKLLWIGWPISFTFLQAVCNVHRIRQVQSYFRYLVHPSIHMYHGELLVWWATF